jgi:hypothetical protein
VIVHTKASVIIYIGDCMVNTKLKGDRQIRINKLRRYKTSSQTRISWIPRRCVISDKILWLRKSVKLTRYITGPGFPVVMHYWISPKEHLLLELAGSIEREPYSIFD